MQAVAVVLVSLPVPTPVPISVSVADSMSSLACLLGDSLGDASPLLLEVLEVVCLATLVGREGGTS